MGVEPLVVCGSRRPEFRRRVGEFRVRSDLPASFAARGFGSAHPVFRSCHTAWLGVNILFRAVGPDPPFATGTGGGGEGPAQAAEVSATRREMARRYFFR